MATETLGHAGLDGGLGEEVAACRTNSSAATEVLSSPAFK